MLQDTLPLLDNAEEEAEESEAGRYVGVVVVVVPDAIHPRSLAVY